MATTIKLKNGSGAPLASDLVQGEPAFDLTNKRLYTENSSGTIIEIGTSPSTIDIDAGTIDGAVIGGSSAAAGTFTTFTSTGIDDNATSTAITIDASQNVGIGTTSPAQELHVAGGDATIRIEDTDGGTQKAFDLKSLGGTFSITDVTASAQRVTLDTNGNVGIGTTSPSGVLQITSDASVNNQHLSIESTESGHARRWSNGIANGANGALRWYDHTAGTERMRLESDGDLHVDGDVIAYSTTISDQRLKDDVETIDSALDKVSNLRGVTYTWNAGSREGQRDMGVIAQEVEAVIPEIVHEKSMALIDGETYKTVDYEKLTAVLIEAVKELKAEIDALKAAQ